MKNWEKRKATFLVVLTISLVTGMVFWLIQPGVRFNLQEVLMIAGVVLIAAFALFLAFRKLRDAKSNLPVEDELSRGLKRRGAATSYYVSLYLWLVLMMIEEKIPLERYSLIGAGILGMALIYALSWIYHRYFTRVQ